MTGVRAIPAAGFAVIVLAASLALSAVPCLAAELTARDVTEAIFKATAAVPADFSGRKLEDLDLSGLDFKHARLPGADLYGADLSTADLSGVNLHGARLDRATIIRANFSGADLSGATLLRPNVFSGFGNDRSEVANFRGAHMSKVRIVANHLDGADFSGADLSGAMLGPVDHAWGEERYSQRAVMVGCNFSGAVLAHANLKNIVFQFANFRGADLTGALLNGADLSRADLTGADLTGADLTGADVDGAIVAGVRGLDTVQGLSSAHNFDRIVR